MISLRKLILEKYPNFIKELDNNLKLFVREIRKELRNEGHVVIAITGYPGVGKSNDAAVLGMLIDENYNFEENICFIPTSNEIEEKYLSLKMFSYLHIDEASRGLHKHKWYDRIQQKLNQLYDTDREGHFKCTSLLMPRFQNFTENFRNFMVKYWINIPCKGYALFYMKDDDKDVKDPWHMDENYKKKLKKWRNKRVFERGLGEKIRIEQLTDCYWFYCKIPAIPKDIWEEYQKLKKESRVKAKAKEPEVEMESYQEKLEREKFEKWEKISKLKKQNHTNVEIASVIGCSAETIRRNLKEMEAYSRMKGKIKSTSHTPIKSTNTIFNTYKNSNFTKV